METFVYVCQECPGNKACGVAINGMIMVNPDTCLLYKDKTAAFKSIF